jgi:hypothetical protein
MSTLERSVRPVSWTLFALILLAAWTSAPVRGEDRPLDLPKDGAWVRYHQHTESVKGGNDGTMIITLSFVGTVVEEGKPPQLRTAFVLDSRHAEGIGVGG